MPYQFFVDPGATNLFDVSAVTSSASNFTLLLQPLHLQVLLFCLQPHILLAQTLDLYFMLNLLLLSFPQFAFKGPLSILKLADEFLELLLCLLMRAGLTSQLVLVLLVLRLQRLDLLALCGCPLLELHYPLVEGPHGIVFGLKQESLRMHELPIRCLLLQEVVVPL